jgi:peptidoglycan/xylan/chitin deacetylase (PgdA/CDA1 family)
LPKRAVLITFDDAYKSIAANAAAICAEFKVPAVFFVNAGFIDGKQWALDNLLCYAMNTAPIDVALAALGISAQPAVDAKWALAVAKRRVSTLSLGDRAALREKLTALTSTHGLGVTAAADLYISTTELRALASVDFEIGNHTFSHVHCRTLVGSELNEEVSGNQSRLERITGRPVRAFSVPYGSMGDLTPQLVALLKASGHRVAFLSESLPNGYFGDPFILSRTSLHLSSPPGLWAEIEALPHLRMVRDFTRTFLRGDQARSADAIPLSK